MRLKYTLGENTKLTPYKNNIGSILFFIFINLQYNNQLLKAFDHIFCQSYLTLTIILVDYCLFT